MLIPFIVEGVCDSAECMAHQPPAESPVTRTWFRSAVTGSGLEEDRTEGREVPTHDQKEEMSERMSRPRASGRRR